RACNRVELEATTQEELDHPDPLQVLGRIEIRLLGAEEPGGPPRAQALHRFSTPVGQLEHGQCLTHGGLEHRARATDRQPTDQWAPGRRLVASAFAAVSTWAGTPRPARRRPAWSARAARCRSLRPGGAPAARAAACHHRAGTAARGGAGRAGWLRAGCERV